MGLYLLSSTISVVSLTPNAHSFAPYHALTNFVPLRDTLTFGYSKTANRHRRIPHVPKELRGAHTHCLATSQCSQPSPEESTDSIILDARLRVRSVWATLSAAARFGGYWCDVSFRGYCTTRRVTLGGGKHCNHWFTYSRSMSTRPHFGHRAECT